MERGGIGEGLRDATLQLSLFLVESVRVLLCVCLGGLGLVSAYVCLTAFCFGGGCYLSV